MKLTAKIRAEKAREIVGDSTEQWLIWCNTNYEADELQRLVAVAADAGCWLVFDEVPSLAAADEDDLPAPLSGDRCGGFPPRLIWIVCFRRRGMSAITSSVCGLCASGCPNWSFRPAMSR